MSPLATQSEAPDYTMHCSLCKSLRNNSEDWSKM